MHTTTIDNKDGTYTHEINFDTSDKHVVYGDLKETLDELYTQAAHKDLNEELERKMSRERDEAKERELKKRKGVPKVEMEGSFTLADAARALKPFFPHLNAEQRRQMMKQQRKGGKGFTKPKMNKQERKRKKK